MPRSSPSHFYRDTRDAAKIVVVDLGFLGDTVHLLPALWEIKDHYPGAALHVLSSPLGCEVLQMVKCVDRAWSFPLGPPSPHWWEHWGLIQKLRRERFDVAFNFSGADRTVLVTAAIRARRTLAYQGARQHFWQPWLISDWLPKQPLRTPAYEGRRHLLELAGFQLKPSRFDLVIPADDLAQASKSVPSNSVHFSLSASSPLKEWPLQRWIELARLCLEKHPDWTILASGSSNPREQDRLKQFASALNSQRVQLLPPGLSIARLAAIISKCRIHAGADSGVLHLAVALNTKTLAIFRDYSGAADWLPVGIRHRHLMQPCPCANQPHPDCAPSGEARCLAQITAPQAAALLEELRSPQL